MSEPIGKPVYLYRPTAREVRSAQALNPQAVEALRLADRAATVRVVVQRGRGRAQELPLPPTVVRVVRETLDAVRHGEPIQLERPEREVSPAQAAQILNVSRPFAQKLMDEGSIPARRVGSHRRARLGDVLAYRDRMAVRRKAALDELVGGSQELGFGYEA